jgi:hypothetical protein
MSVHILKEPKILAANHNCLKPLTANPTLLLHDPEPV